MKIESTEGGGFLPICSRFISFGQCSAGHRCKDRHTLIDADQNRAMPSSGLVRFKIYGVKNPLCYAIHIKKYLPEGSNQWISYKSELIKIKEALKEMHQYMEKEKDKLIEAVIGVGGLYAFFYASKCIWRRVKVLRKEYVVDEIYLIMNNSLLFFFSEKKMTTQYLQHLMWTFTRSISARNSQ